MNFKRICKEFISNSLLLWFFNLNLLGRHFLLCSSVNYINFFSTEPYSSSASIHSSITAAANSNFFADINRIALNYTSEKINTAVNTLCILAFNPHRSWFPCTRCKNNGIIYAFKIFNSDILTEFNIIAKANSCFFNNFNFAVEYLFRQTILRNTVSEHTAHFFHHIENSYLVAKLSKIVSRSKTGRTAAYNCNLFACTWRTLWHKAITLKVKVSRKALELNNINRLVNLSSSAGFFARVRTHSADRCRKRNFFFNKL